MDTSLEEPPVSRHFPEGDGVLPNLIRAFDWSNTTLGPIDCWPSSLKTTVRLITASPVPMIIYWGVDGVAIYNDAYIPIAGGHHPGLLGAKGREGWSEVADFIDDFLRVGLQGGALSYRDHAFVLQRSGSPEMAWFNVDVSPVPDDAGAPGGVLLVISESTHRVLSDDRARLEQERQRHMLKQMPGFVGMLSGPELIYTYVNDAYVEISERTDFIGRRFRDVFADITGQGFHELFEKVFSTGEGVVTRGMELRLHGRAEPQYVDFVLEPLRDDTGEVIGVFVGGYETTEIYRAAERERREMQDALRQSQKMDAMGQLTGGVAHDFNNLLMPIIGSLDMLQRKGLGDARSQRMVEGALQSAERAKTLVQRLLAFARRQPLQPTPVDIAGLVHGMRDLLGSTVGPRIVIDLDIDDDLPAAVADANQVEMALLNLAVNARDAMPDGGTLTIAVGLENLERGHEPDLQPGAYLRLCVHDTGVGMDEATRLKAAEPFFSTKGVGRGTGLGLSMVHGLAAQLGGALSLESAPGEGTTVKIWLPVAIKAAALPTAPTDPQFGLGSGTVLLVDDEDLVRASTADMLADLGYRVVEAQTAEEALRRLDEEIQVDLLITDHLMPGMTGADLARAVGRRKADLPVLVISGYAEAEGIAPEFQRLTKPFRQAELALALATLTNGASE